MINLCYLFNTMWSSSKFIYFFLAISVCHCYTDDWNMFIFTQEWPTTVCVMGEQEHHRCVIPSVVSGWGIHGLWPTLQGTRGPTNCGGGSAFDPNRLKSLESQLEALWPNMYADTSQTSFWEHEYNKHGRCAASLPITATEVDYFQTALNIMANYSATSILEKHGIVPSKTVKYTLKQVASALEKELNVSPIIECAYDSKTKEHMFYEIEICLNKELKIISCNEPTSTVRGVRHHTHHTSSSSSNHETQNGNCPQSEEISYPPFRSNDPAAIIG